MVYKEIWILTPTTAKKGIHNCCWKCCHQDRWRGHLWSGDLWSLWWTWSGQSGLHKSHRHMYTAGLLLTCMLQASKLLTYTMYLQYMLHTKHKNNFFFFDITWCLMFFNTDYHNWSLICDIILGHSRAI